MAGKESMDHGWWRMDFPRSETAGCVEIKLGQERWKMDGEIAVPLKGSGRRQERALTPSVIHSTKVATRKEMSRLLGKSGTAKISVSRTLSLSSVLFGFVWWKTGKERSGQMPTGDWQAWAMAYGPWPTAHWSWTVEGSRPTTGVGVSPFFFGTFSIFPIEEEIRSWSQQVCADGFKGVFWLVASQATEQTHHSR